MSRDTLRRIQGHIRNLADPDDKTSYQAERRLMRFGPRAVELLIVAATDPNPRVRFRAVWVLGKSRDLRAFPAILHLTRDPDGRVSYDATLALGELGDTRAVPHLTALVGQAGPEDALADAALSALRKLAPRPTDDED